MIKKKNLEKKTGKKKTDKDKIKENSEYRQLNEKINKSAREGKTRKNENQEGRKINDE